MSISVIIPTYNRAETLRKTLLAYAEQSGQHGMHEVLVIDDGSKDHTASVVEECNQRFPVPLRYFIKRTRPGGQRATTPSVKRVQICCCLATTILSPALGL